MKVEVKINGYYFNALVDTGSDVTIIKRSFYEKIYGSQNITLASDTLMRGFVKKLKMSHDSISVTMEINGHKFDANNCQVVADDIHDEVMIGRERFDEKCKS